MATLAQLRSIESVPINRSLESIIIWTKMTAGTLQFQSPSASSRSLCCKASQPTHDVPEQLPLPPTLSMSSSTVVHRRLRSTLFRTGRCPLYQVRTQFEASVDAVLLLRLPFKASISWSQPRIWWWCVCKPSVLVWQDAYRC